MSDSSFLYEEFFIYKRKHETKLHYFCHIIQVLAKKIVIKILTRLRQKDDKSNSI